MYFSLTFFRKLLLGDFLECWVINKEEKEDKKLEEGEETKQDKMEGSEENEDNKSLLADKADDETFYNASSSLALTAETNSSEFSDLLKR